MRELAPSSVHETLPVLVPSNKVLYPRVGHTVPLRMSVAGALGAGNVPEVLQTQLESKPHGEVRVLVFA